MKLPPLANENFRFAADAIRIPYGVYPYGNVKVKVDGVMRTVSVAQIVDKASAEAFGALVNEKVKTGKGIPIYHGHPDVPSLAAKYPDKRAYGWITACTSDDAGITLVPLWNEAPGEHFSHFSPYWFGPLADYANDKVNMLMRNLYSVALSNDPNIESFRLANEAGEEDTNLTVQTKGTHMDITELLKALGLPEGSTMEQILAAIAVKDAAVKDLDTKLAAAQAEGTTASGALANERTARIELVLVTAVERGQITAAGMPAWRARLDKDTDGGITALANEKALKTLSALPEIKTKEASAEDIGALANARAQKDGCSFDVAWKALKAERPELFK